MELTLLYTFTKLIKKVAFFTWEDFQQLRPEASGVISCCEQFFNLLSKNIGFGRDH